MKKTYFPLWLVTGLFIIAAIWPVLIGGSIGMPVGEIFLVHDFLTVS